MYSIKLGGGFKYFLFSPLVGEDSHFDEHIFQRGLKPPTRKHLVFCDFFILQLFDFFGLMDPKGFVDMPGTCRGGVLFPVS